MQDNEKLSGAKSVVLNFMNSADGRNLYEACKDLQNFKEQCLPTLKSALNTPSSSFFPGEAKMRWHYIQSVLEEVWQDSLPDQGLAGSLMCCLAMWKTPGPLETRAGLCKWVADALEHHHVTSHVEAHIMMSMHKYIES